MYSITITLRWQWTTPQPCPLFFRIVILIHGSFLLLFHSFLFSIWWALKDALWARLDSNQPSMNYEFTALPLCYRPTKHPCLICFISASLIIRSFLGNVNHLLESVALTYSRPIVVNELFKISVQVYHDSFFGSKKHDLFGYAFDRMDIVRHLHAPIQFEHEALVEDQGIGYVVTVVFQVQLIDKGHVTNSGQSHASGPAYVEPPGRQGRIHADPILVRQQLDQALCELMFVAHIKERPGRRRSSRPQ